MTSQKSNFHENYNKTNGASESLIPKHRTYKSTVYSIWKKLVDPCEKISNKTVRKKARLLSVFLFCLFFLFLGINMGYKLFIPDYSVPLADKLGYIFLVTAYIISRTRYTKIATIIMLVMFPFNVFMCIFTGTSPNVTATFSYLIPSYILASIFLPLSYSALYGLLVCFFITLMPWLLPSEFPAFFNILGPLSVNLLSIALLIIAVIHRDRIERDRQDELKKAYNATLEGWSYAMEIRDKETKVHCTRVIDLTMQMAKALGLDEKERDNILRGALLHDIGKMAIPDSILMKPAPLSDEEWEIMKKHPIVACEILSSISFLKPSMDIPAYHHEWWNGKGYPHGLSGEQSPRAARIVSVAGVWDALLSDRPYRKAWDKDQAIQYLHEQSGKQFDPQMTKLFLSLNLDKNSAVPQS